MRAVIWLIENGVKCMVLNVCLWLLKDIRRVKRQGKMQTSLLFTNLQRQMIWTLRKYGNRLVMSYTRDKVDSYRRSNERNSEHVGQMNSWTFSKDWQWSRNTGVLLGIVSYCFDISEGKDTSCYEHGLPVWAHGNCVGCKAKTSDICNLRHGEGGRWSQWREWEIDVHSLCQKVRKKEVEKEQC